MNACTSDQFLEHLRAGIENYERRWRLADTLLRDICNKYPRHDAIGEVYAKVLIIGRSYASGIERQVKVTEEGKASLESIADCILEHGTEVNELIEAIDGCDKPRTSEPFKSALQSHLKMVKILESVTRENRTPRSFASKYLHFHRSCVPIYDLIAEEKLKKLVRWREIKKGEQFSDVSDADETYRKYVVRFWKLYTCCDKRYSVKELDAALLWNPNSSAREIKLPLE